MRYLLALCFIITQLAAMEKPVTVWASHEVLLQPNAPDWLPSMLSPKALERDLLEAVAADTEYTNDFAAKQPGTSLSVAMKAWLLDLENGQFMKELARKNISTWKQPVLYHVAGAAFSPEEAASHLKAIPKVVALAQGCKDYGCTIALACNSHSASFAAIEAQHAFYTSNEDKKKYPLMTLFPHKFISGQRKKLTMDSDFFKDIKNELGAGSYYYIDVVEGTGKESLEAAKDAGITPITITSAAQLETDLKALKLSR